MRCRPCRLREFVKAEGLDVKTSGPGRKKKAIYADIVAAMESSISGSDAEPAAETAASEAPAAEAPAAEAPAETPAAKAEVEAAGAPPPAGFEWGATF